MLLVFQAPERLAEIIADVFDELTEVCSTPGVEPLWLEGEADSLWTCLNQWDKPLGLVTKWDDTEACKSWMKMLKVDPKANVRDQNDSYGLIQMSVSYQSPVFRFLICLTRGSLAGPFP